MMKLRRLFLIVAMVLAVGYSYAEAPANYYNSAEGKSGADLLSELCSIIGPHTDIGYSGLWTCTKTLTAIPALIKSGICTPQKNGLIAPSNTVAAVIVL